MDEQKHTKNKEDAKVKVREQFIRIMSSLFQSLNEVFPECEKTASVSRQFNRHIVNNPKMEETIITKWHNEMKPHYNMCKNRNFGGLQESNISFFDSIDIHIKWKDPGFSDQSKDNLWEYVNELNMHAEVFHTDSDTESDDNEDQIVLSRSFSGMPGASGATTPFQSQILNRVPSSLLQKFMGVTEDMMQKSNATPEQMMQNFDLGQMMGAVGQIMNETTEDEAESIQSLLPLLLQSNVEDMGVDPDSAAGKQMNNLLNLCRTLTNNQT